MVNSPYFDLFQNDSVDKQLKIEFDGGVITNEELHQQQFELTESLCSESELRFGSCEASSIKFKISNVFLPLKDKWLTVSIILNGNTEEPFLIGKYKVYSDAPTADRRFRDVVAYDAMYDIINAYVADWYNSVLPNKDSAITLKQFRSSFISHFGLEQENADLVNDNMVVEKTIEPSEISGKDVITAICEINGCFGHIGRDGKFKWIYLPQLIQGLYPANDLYPDHAPDYLPYQQETGHLYPQDPKSSKIGKSLYISCSYEDFITKEIKKLHIRKEENDIGAIVGTDGNTYIIEDNFLVYEKSASDLKVIANNVLRKIKGVIYRPFESDCKGNLCFEVGDPVSFSTKYKIVESYILQRTLKGIQALRDNYSAKGALKYAEKVNSVQKSIIQLKGKTNTIVRTVEETRIEIKDIEKGLSSRIKQTAQSIEAEVTRATKAEGELSSSITINAEKITAEVERATTEEGKLNTSISSVKQTADGIYAEIYNSGGLKTQIQATAEGLSSKVSKGNVSSEISQESGKISIKSNRISIDSTYFTLTEDGKIKAVSGTFSGDITGSTITGSIFRQNYSNGIFEISSGIMHGDFEGVGNVCKFNMLSAVVDGSGSVQSYGCQLGSSGHIVISAPKIFTGTELEPSYVYGCKTETLVHEETGFTLLSQESDAVKVIFKKMIFKNGMLVGFDV